MKLARTFLLMVAVASPVTHANLITNGSFEDNVVAKGTWNWFSADKVNGWDGSNIEIWHQFAGVQAYEGKQLMELNAHGANQGAWSVYQPFATTIGQRYQLSFAYRARASQNEQFQVSVANLLQTVQNRDTKQWTLFTSSFIAQDTVSVLRFTSLTNGTVGNFLDDVQVNALVSLQRAAIPTGPLWPLLGLALAWLCWRRRS